MADSNKVDINFNAATGKASGDGKKLTGEIEKAGKVTPELYAEHIVDAVSLIAYEVPADMRESGWRQIDDAVVLDLHYDVISFREDADDYAAFVDHVKAVVYGILDQRLQRER